MASASSGPERRMSSLWLLPPAVTLVLVIPVLREAAKLDRYWYDDQETRVREHAGLFLVYAAAVAVPALLGALASKRARVLGIAAIVLSLAMGAMCEAWVSIATWH